MSDVGDNNFVNYIYRGEADEEIPRGGKIIVIVADADAVTIVRTRTFENHPNIIEVICHEGVEKIEEGEFSNCHSSRRVIMPGVKLVGEFAFFGCDALTEVDSGKLEIIKEHAFSLCKSLRSINLPSVQLVEERAFAGCDTLTDVKFGNNLRRIERGGFIHCAYLERIAIPLKDGMITMDDTFVECNNLKHVDLVGDIHETIAALQFKEWRDDMNNGVNLISIGFFPMLMLAIMNGNTGRRLLRYEHGLGLSSANSCTTKQSMNTS